MKHKATATLLCVSLAIAFSSSVFAQGSIQGKLLSEDGEPSAYATVMLMRTSDTTMVKANTTDEAGVYQLFGAPDGEYYVEASYVGFSNARSDVFSYKEGATQEVPNMILRVASQELDEVMVRSTRPLVEVHPDKTVFNVDGSINASGNTALELLRKSPGVVVDNNDNIMLAGKSGVKIYIDDKPSPLSTDDLANYLKSMQSSEIDNIEIITNPSAKYDAEGNAGIINIILKKDKSLGTNGSATLGYRYGKSPKYNASGNINYRNKTMNVFGSYSYFNGEFENEFDLRREQFGTVFDQENDRRSSNVNHNFRAGTDFFLDKKSTIGFLVTGNLSDNDNSGISLTEISPVGGDIDNILEAKTERNGERNNLNFNVNYLYKGDNDMSWNVDLDYGRYRNEGYSYQPNRYFDADYQNVEEERIYAFNSPTDINIYTAKFDHERNWLGGKFGFGAKVSFVETDNTFEYFDIPDGTPILNLEQSNNFVFEENINAGYLSYQRNLSEKWNMMLGLRVENTQSTGTLTSIQMSDDDVVDRNYTDWFPSAGITYQLNQKNSFRLNYSRRIDRPGYDDLNPFEYKLDELSYQKGNAFLRPQYSNSISFTHTYNYRLNTSLSYTKTADMFTRITQSVSDSASILTFVNLASQTNLSLSVSYPFSVSKWWNVYATTTAYTMRNKAVIDGDEIDLDAQALSFYAQNTFLLPKGFKFELSGWYNSPAIWQGNWSTISMYSIDIGIQKKLLDDRATLKVSFSDVFNSQKWGGESRFGELYIKGGGNWESQQLRVNFSYLFGNKQVKSARKRSTGMEDESGRVGSGDN